MEKEMKINTNNETFIERNTNNKKHLVQKK